jgi:hypothetical protein
MAFGFFCVNLAGLWLDWWELAIAGFLTALVLLFTVAALPDSVPDASQLPAGATKIDPDCASDLPRIRLCLLLCAVTKMSGIDLFCANLNWFGIGGAPVLAVPAALLLGLAVAARHLDGVAARSAWCGSLAIAVIAAAALGLAIQSDCGQPAIVAAIVCFGLAAELGFLPVCQRVQWDYFQQCRVPDGTRSSFFAIDGLASFLLVYAYSLAVGETGADGVILYTVWAMLIGSAWGWYALKPAAQTEEEDGEHETSPLLEQGEVTGEEEEEEELSEG